MKITSLKEHKEFISILAKWHYDEWSYLHDVDSVERRISEFEDELESDEIPQTFVAVENDVLVGSSSLLPHDMDTRMDLTPWLASVYVPVEYRKRGFGSALVRHVVKEACKRGYRALYLYTPGREEFYVQLGWSLIERTEYHGEDVSIMTINTE
jgi:predicted N-acetyltransferase YhbS